MKGIFKNPGLKLMALAFAVGLWFFVAGQSTIEVGYLVPVGFNGVRPDMVVSSTDPVEVEVRVRGPKFIMNNIAPSQITAEVNLEKAHEGLNSKRVMPQNVVTPTGTQAVSLQPDSVDVWMEVLTKKELPVKVRLRGRPAKGYRISGLKITPRTVSVTGMKNEVKDLDGVYSEPVDVEGLKASRVFTARLEAGTGLRNISADEINVHVIVRKD